MPTRLAAKCLKMKTVISLFSCIQHIRNICIFLNALVKNGTSYNTIRVIPSGKNVDSLGYWSRHEP